MTETHPTSPRGIPPARSWGRRLVASAASLLLLAGFGAAQAQDITTGLVAHYPLDGDGLDASGNGYDATAFGGVSFVGGQIGSAASFDNSTGYMEADLDVDTITGAAPRTVSFWMNRNSADNGNMVTIGNNSVPGARFSVLMDGSGLIRLIGSFQDYSAISSAPLSTWVHVAATYDGTDLQFYFNGAADGAPQEVDPAFVTASALLRIGVNSPENNEFYGGCLFLYSNQEKKHGIRVQ